MGSRMIHPAHPPAIAQHLLAVCVRSREMREAVIGDLQEEFAHICAIRDRRAAARWYVAQTTRSVPLLLWWRAVRGVGRMPLRAVAVGTAVLVGGFVAMAWLAVTVVASLAPPPELRFPL